MDYEASRGALPFQPLSESKTLTLSHRDSGCDIEIEQTEWIDDEGPVIAINAELTVPDLLALAGFLTRTITPNVSVRQHATWAGDVDRFRVVEPEEEE